MVNLAVVEQLLNHINRHTLCKTTDKILLAVSGGVDSVVMFHLFKEAGYKIGVAHCNFQLRGVDSDGDEQWVQEICRQYHVPCLVKKFDTETYATAHGMSTQMAARDLRYNFFQEIITAQGYDYVATAHHFSDTVESVFMNLVRGTGIDGVRGISPKKDKIIRPMLFATREMIMSYASKNNIAWREDASNATDDYQRNFLRHRVIPRLTEMNPSFEEGFRQTHERLLGARTFALAYIEEVKKSAVSHRDQNSMTIDIRKVRQSEYADVLLWELIKDLGFKFDQCKKITADHQPGKIFLSETHQLLVDRTNYIIDRRQARSFLSQSIAEGQRIANAGEVTLVLKEVARENFKLAKDSAIAQLDADLVVFPLLWRKWQAGDYFVPLGMRAEKKVSDFLIDLKVPFNNKADITLLESGRDIVWIVGHRVNERYKVTSETRRILVIEQRETSD